MAAVTTPTYTGQSDALLVNPALKVLGGPTSGLITIPAGTHICQAGPLPAAGGSFTGCNGNVTLNPGGTVLGSADVLNETATGAPDASSTPTSSAASQIASLTLLPGMAPGGKDVLDATVLDASTSLTCTTHSASASIATLSIGGQTVVPPDATGPNQVVPVGSGANTLATVTLDYQNFDPATNTETASPLVVNFPTDGPLAPLIQGTVYLSYAQSDMAGCPATPPTDVAEAPFYIAVPVVGLAVFGGFWYWRRRRSLV